MTWFLQWNSVTVKLKTLRVRTNSLISLFKQPQQQHSRVLSITNQQSYLRSSEWHHAKTDTVSLHNPFSYPDQCPWVCRNWHFIDISPDDRLLSPLFEIWRSFSQGGATPLSTTCSFGGGYNPWVSLRGDWAIFCHTGSGWVGRVWSTREKSLEILRRGRKLNTGYRMDRQWNTFILPLSYQDPGHGEDRQWAIPLSYHDQGHREDRQWDTFILPLSYCDWLYLNSISFNFHSLPV